MLFPPATPLSDPVRVVVTGAGIVTGLGCGWRANAEGFRSGRKAFAPVTLFDVSRQRARIAAEVALPETGEGRRLRFNRASQMLMLAAREAWNQCGWTPAGSLPLVLGTTSCGAESGEAFYRAALLSPSRRPGQAARALHYQAQQQALDVLETLGFTGPITLIANACASGSNAIGHAWELVRHGHASRALTGGYDALSQMVFAGFDSLQALSTVPCRPFAAARDGLTLGEGAAVLALEALPHARARGAEILGEIIGYGAATDTHHLTQPQPQGDAALASMTEACARAGLRPEEVSYLNAHGTGTPLNDAAEAIAITRWAGRAAAGIPVSSTKAGVGHLLGAAGAVEAVVCLMTLREQWLPPQPGLGALDPACGFPIVQKATDARVETVLSNSFGFGGANASLIFRRFA